jgi:XTP/dITP diphosphohydrolase
MNLACWYSSTVSPENEVALHALRDGVRGEMCWWCARAGVTATMQAVIARMFAWLAFRMYPRGGVAVLQPIGGRGGDCGDSGQGTIVKTILVGTQNAGKRREYETLLAGLPVIWVSPEELGLANFDVNESGATFEENARLKALAFARQAGVATLADDSGLAVDALNGAPGVYSARYAGPGASDEDRYRKLLAALEGVPDAQRTAHFECVVALALPDGAVYSACGRVEGAIACAPRGREGFGYDPIFVLPDGRHMAELLPPEKNALSHRGRALQALRPVLLRILETLDGSSRV